MRAFDYSFYQSKEAFSNLFRCWTLLSSFQQERLIEQLKAIDLSLLHKQQEALRRHRSSSIRKVQAFNDFSYWSKGKYQSIGQERIKAGELGCVLLAGGQGSRLRFEGPKGLYPISPIKHKSLFQLFAEKTLAASRQAGIPLSLAIMTSSLNDQLTKEHFEQANFFGLEKERVSFFTQKNLPFLNEEGRLFLETPDQAAMGPDGNGFFFKNFMEAGIASKWSRQGIKHVNVILIDNPLADPFDKDLLGFHVDQAADVTLKCTEKLEPEEKVGVIVKEGRHCRVIEYSEIAEEEKQARLADGRLKHRCANLSLFCFSMDFIQKTGQRREPILHPSWKSTKFLDEQGASRLSEKPNAWKFEAFIFDVLAYADRVAALLYPREECFAPLKNPIGADSPELVKRAMQAQDKKMAYLATGLVPLSDNIELAPDFYYPTQELLTKWKGRQIKEGYIEP